MSTISVFKSPENDFWIEFRFPPNPAIEKEEKKFLQFVVPASGYYGMDDLANINQYIKGSYDNYFGENNFETLPFIDLSIIQPSTDFLENEQFKGIRSLRINKFLETGNTRFSGPAS